jgi:hypothetical protein
MFRGAESTPNMYSVLPHKHGIHAPPPRVLIRAVYGVCIDGMLLAGKLRVWEQWANFHLVLGV